MKKPKSDADKGTTKGPGRPTKEARDAAVFLAYMWRCEVIGETSNQAQEWVRQAWAFHGLGADAANVRRALRLAERRGLRTNWLVRVHELFTAVECVGGREIVDGARVWLWAPGMIEAQEGVVRNAAHNEYDFSLTPLAAAMRQR